MERDEVERRGGGEWNKNSWGRRRNVKTRQGRDERKSESEGV